VLTSSETQSALPPLQSSIRPGSEDPRDRERAAERGASGFFPKPSHFDGLVEVAKVFAVRWSLVWTVGRK